MDLLGIKLSGRYEIVRELGRGGMGVVYLARDPLLDRDVAVKLVPPHLLDAEAGDRFRREARLVAKMDHPGVVTIYDVGEYDGALFYVMPLVTGSTLRELLAFRMLRLGEVLDVGIQVADALEHSHALGVVHRDLRPENITVAASDGEGMRVRITDFGLAQASFESQLTRVTETATLGVGAAYISPEQVEGRDVDARSDVYSLGVVLYECLTGAPPFVGSAEEVLFRVVHEVAPRPSDAGIAVDPTLEELVLRCLAKDPDRRPQRARDVVEALERCRARLHTDERARVVGGGRGGRSPARDVLPFVGRDRELAALQSCLATAVGGAGQFALVSGEAGIGKTRLLNEIERAGRGHRALALRGRFVAEDRGFPFQGFCEVIQEFYRLREGPGFDAETPDVSDLAADLVRLFPVLSEIPELAEGAESAAVIEPPVRRLDDRTAVFELLARALARLAASRPLVVLFEDLHDADVSVEALQYVVRRLGSSPILIVGSYRPSEVHRRHSLARAVESFRGDRAFTSVQLGPLPASEHRDFIEAILDYARVTDGLAATLYAATEGNPFFTIELVRSLVDSGGIAEDEAGLLALSSEMGLTSDALPDTIQQVVERQIERLPEELRDVLSVAAVLGRTFEARDLEAVADAVDDVEDAIERLLRDGLLEEREWRGDRLAFASRVVRDVLYARLSRRRRRALHRRYAAYLEERYAGRLDRVYTPLLHHYSLGDVPEKAVEYGFQAALKALDAYSAEDAITSIRTALEFLGDEDWESDPSLEGEARLVLAGAFRIQGNLADALREAERAEASFERVSQGFQALRAALMAAEIAWDHRRIEDTRRWVERGVERARALDDSWTLARLLTLGATVANLRGEYDVAKEYLEEAEQLGETRERRALPRGGRLVVGLNNPIPIAAEPAVVKTGDDEEVLANVFERLLTTDANGSLKPVLCERWEMLDAGSTFLVTLRVGEVFSDGTLVTAADVKRSFERAVRATGDPLPAAFAAIRGAADFLAGRAAELAGVTARSEREVEIRLSDPLPLYPSLLTDVMASIVRETSSGDLLGTGPFLLVQRSFGHVLLGRNPAYARTTPANLDELEFRTALGPVDVAAGFRSGELDVVRGFADDEAERLLRDSRLRATLVDSPRKETCFVLFNAASPALADPRVRRALAGVVRVRPLVWQTLGRRALPATGLIPPGMLGHDPGRRLPSLERDRAVDLLRSAGVEPGVRLTAAVSPKFNEFQGALVAGVFEAWADLGVRVAISTSTVDAYLEAMDEPGDADLLLARWSADYDDPDNFTYGVFHSRAGSFRRWWSSQDLDEIAEQARAETRPDVRDALYRRFESALIEAGAVVPLFHALDARLVGRSVRNLQTGNAPPYVNYAALGKEVGERRSAVEAPAGGTVRAALSSGQVRSLDPALVVNTEMSEVVPNVYETLTRVVEGARVVPWLAEEFHAEDGGRRFRFRLRPDVRFHDGRRLTARDVRYSFERLLQQRRARATRNALLPIRGARALADGEAGDLEGFRIHSAMEFSVELDVPLPYFAVLLTDPCTAIVPEGQQRFDASWREQCAGTGPFRVVALEPGARVELERNPGYWREGYPRCEGLVFTFGLSPEQVLVELRAGRLSLAAGLAPEDVEVLRHDPEFAPRYFEAPSLSVAFMAFNTRSGPLADVELRRRVARAIDVSGAVRRALGRFVRPANGVVLPGLVGHDPAREARATQPAPERVEPEVELTVAVAGGFARTLGRLVGELVDGMGRAGVRLRVLRPSAAELDELRESAAVDMIWTVWVADFPDTDGIVGAVLHSAEGAYGRLSGSLEIDRLIERGRTETDVAARHAIYRQLETLLARDAIVLPVVHPHHYRFARPEVEGVACNSLSYPVVPYENLRIR